jgi:putative spermidine/putrescine transport system permease protein
MRAVRRLPDWVPLAPAALFMLLFYAGPLLRFIAISVTQPQPGLANYANLLVPRYLHVFASTFEIAGAVALLCLVLGYPVALLLARTRGGLLALLTACVVVPFFTSDLVRNYAWIFLLGARGAINGVLLRTGVIDQPLTMIFDRFAVLVALTHLLLPYMILILAGALRGLDPRLLAAAGSLGAGPFGTFRRVVLPLSARGALGGAILVFVIGLASFVTPAMLGGRTDIMAANVIGTEMGVLHWGAAAAVGSIMLLLTLLALLLLYRVAGGFMLVAPGLGREAAAPGTRRASRAWRLGIRLDALLDPVWTPLVAAAGWLIIGFLVLPLLVIIPLSLTPLSYFVFPPPGLSLRWYAALLADPRWTEAAQNSIALGLAVAAFCLAIGIPAAHAIVRSKSRLVAPAYLVLVSPLVVPSIIIAVAVFFLLSYIGLLHTLLGVGLGQAVTALPPALVVLVVALQGYDWTLTRAGQSLGASPLRTLFRVTLPMIRGEVATAAFLGFLHSFNDLLVALFVSGLRTETLPKRMWESLEEIDPSIAAVATLLVLFTLALLALVQVPGWLRRCRAHQPVLP